MFYCINFQFFYLILIIFTIFSKFLQKNLTLTKITLVTRIPGDMPSPLSLPSSSGSNPNAGSVHRPIPMLSRVGGQHPRLQALQASSGQCSLPVVTSNSNIEAENLNSNGNKQGMSRSISDSTLRRAALHLNLNQSVLPSFTSLQQFKVWSCS